MMEGKMTRKTLFPGLLGTFLAESPKLLALMLVTAIISYVIYNGLIWANFLNNVSPGYTYVFCLLAVIFQKAYRMEMASRK